MDYYYNSPQTEPYPPQDRSLGPNSAYVPARPSQSSSTISTPEPEDFNTSTFQGSMQQILSDNLGTFVVIEFLVGTSGMTIKEGILYFVGRSYLILYEELNDTYIACDIFSIKFVTFYNKGNRPLRRINSIVNPTQSPNYPYKGYPLNPSTSQNGNVSNNPNVNQNMNQGSNPNMSPRRP